MKGHPGFFPMGILNNRCRIITRTQKGTIILTTTDVKLSIGDSTCASSLRNAFLDRRSASVRGHTRFPHTTCTIVPPFKSQAHPLIVGNWAALMSGVL